MGRPTDWSALGYDKDPTPGEPATIRELANHVRDIAESISESLGRFNELNCTDEFWRSEEGSAEGFKELKGALPEDLGMAKTRYENVAGALDTWVDALSGVQSRADDALRRADEAVADLAYANNGIDDMEEFKENAERTAEENGGEPEEWTGQDFYALKSDAEDRLERAKEDVGGAIDDRDQAADDAGRTIEDAANDELKNKSGWTKFWLGLADVLSVAAAIVGILAIFFPVLAPLALGLALASALLTTALYIAGEKSLTDVALELVGLATLGLGRAGIAGVRAFKAMPFVQRGVAASGRYLNARVILSSNKGLPRILGSAVNPRTGKTMSGAALARFTVREGADNALAEMRRMASVYNRIMYPAKPTWAGTFGSWRNITNTASQSWNEITASAGAFNGPAGLAVVGSDLMGTGISGKQTFDSVSNYFTADHWSWAPRP